MKIHELGHSIIDKFTPMDETRKNELKLQAIDSYNKAVAKARQEQKEINDAIEFNETFKKEIDSNDDKYQAKSVKKLSLLSTAIIFIDSWWMQYVFAALFIFAVPKIKNFMEGKIQEAQEEEEEPNEFEEYLEWKRFKNRTR